MVVIAQNQLSIYEGLDLESRVIAQQKADEIKKLVRRSNRDIIDIGEKLTEIKSRLPQGTFISWLEQEFDWSIRTAQFYMSVFSRKNEFGGAIENFAPSALYLLSAESVPSHVRETAIETAETEKVTHKLAKELTEAAKATKKALKSVEPGDYIQLADFTICQVISVSKLRLEVEIEGKPLYVDRNIETIKSVAGLDWIQVNDELGSFGEFGFLEKSNVKFELFLVYTDNTNDICGVQIRSADGSLNLQSAFIDFTLDPFAEDLKSDRNWWLLQAEKFVKSHKSHWTESSLDTPQSGHLKAIPKPEPKPKIHPAFEKFGVGQKIATPDGNGQIISKTEQTVVVELLDGETEFSFSEIRQWPSEILADLNKVTAQLESLKKRCINKDNKTKIETAIEILLTVADE